jgi:hypothetical protein
MSNGIVHSIQFTEKLINSLHQQLGSDVLMIAEEVTPCNERQGWPALLAEDPINTYIKNMRFLVNFLEKLSHTYGEQIEKLTSELVAAEEHYRWGCVREQLSDHSIDSFIQAAWEPLRPVGFVFEVHKKPDGAQIHCTSCPIHELSKLIGGAKWLAILECNKDLHNIGAFNSKLSMKRTKTLMKGDSHCDHYYIHRNFTDHAFTTSTLSDAPNRA